MSIQSLEAQIRAWQERVTVISRNLMELAESEPTRVIRSRMKDKDRPFTGVTAQSAQQTIQSIDGLWEDYVLLANVVDRAQDLFNENGVFSNYNEEILSLLNGDSVELPAVHVPLLKRDLLDASQLQSNTTLAVVLEAMKQEFTVARDQVARIYAADKEAAAQMAALKIELTELKNLAQTLSISMSELESATQSLAVCESDPLQAAQDLAYLAERLVQQRIQLMMLDGERNIVAGALTTAAEKLTELGDLIRNSDMAIHESKEKILNPLYLEEPAARQAIAPLQSWLNTLNETFSAGRWQAVQVGLTKWNADCDAYLASERQRHARNRSGLDERQELRGRFKALHAKYQIFVQRGMPPGEHLAALIAHIDPVLKTLPFDLQAARHMVNSFEAGLYTATSQFATAHHPAQ